MNVVLVGENKRQFIPNFAVLGRKFLEKSGLLWAANHLNDDNETAVTLDDVKY